MFASSRRPVRHFAMSGVDDDKWRRALLKKLRAAVAVKTRVDAGDASSLQKTQVGKGSKKAIDDVLAKLKAAGLGRDAAEVRAAFATGKSEGESAMSAAAKRGPDGGADGTPSKKRLKREARASRRPDDGRVSRGGGDDARAPRPASEARNPGVSGHQFAACKRAVLALHALAKNPGSPDPNLADALRALTPKLAAAADARLASVALWSLAKSAQRALHPDDAANLARLAAALTDRVAAVARDMDARGLSTSLWSLASLATDATRSWNRSETAPTTTRTARFDAATAATAARPSYARSPEARTARTTRTARKTRTTRKIRTARRPRRLGVTRGTRRTRCGRARKDARAAASRRRRTRASRRGRRRGTDGDEHGAVGARVATRRRDLTDRRVRRRTVVKAAAARLAPTVRVRVRVRVRSPRKRRRTRPGPSGNSSAVSVTASSATTTTVVGSGRTRGWRFPAGPRRRTRKRRAREKSSSEMVSASRDLVSSFATISASAPPGAYSRVRWRTSCGRARLWGRRATPSLRWLARRPNSPPPRVVARRRNARGAASRRKPSSDRPRRTSPRRSRRSSARGHG